MISKCDVCRREGETFVASLTTGAMSIAFCKECLKNGAEPEWCFEYLWSDVGDRGEGLAEWVKDLSTWKGDRYWTWEDWNAWRRSQDDGTP